VTTLDRGPPQYCRAVVEPRARVGRAVVPDPRMSMCTAPYLYTNNDQGPSVKVNNNALAGR